MKRARRLPVLVPQELMEFIDQHRREDCTEYKACISRAAYLDWQNFSCQGCENYQPTQQCQPELVVRPAQPLGWDF